MKYYIIAGEASGDLHGSNLIKELNKLDATAHIRCWGGDKMEAAGGILVKHIRDLAFMGFAEVLLNLPTIFRNFKFCRQDILQYKPDTLILIDYPGFNLRIAKWAKRQGLKVIYYISPQVWAWKESRVKMMKKCIDKMLVILPFEKNYYNEKWNWNVEYVGHPLVEVINEFRAGSQDPIAIGSGVNDSELPIQNSRLIALLPGSRKQEISKKLPVMLEVCKYFPGYQFIVAQAPSIEDNFYKSFTQQYPNVSTVSNKTYELLMQSKAALVTSGTATLETALFGVPQVVCYKGSFITYHIAKRLVKVKYIAMVNLIMDKPVVVELIQQELTAENLKLELNEILTNDSRTVAIKKDYAELMKLLCEGGPDSPDSYRDRGASAKAAQSIYNFLINGGV